MTKYNLKQNQVSGGFVTMGTERYYEICNMDQMGPFFISLVSNSDHWLFISTTGGLTAGRVSPDTALFPYTTVDKIHDDYLNTGSKTIFRVVTDEQKVQWQPFNQQQNTNFNVSRNIYKNTLGNKLCFEEVNHDLKLSYRYTWMLSHEYGFVRESELINEASTAVKVDVLDGLQNILPAGTPRFTQTNSSNLVDAYKWTEVDKQTGLAFFTLFSGITDRAEPCESLNANTVFSLGLSNSKILISTEQIAGYLVGEDVAAEYHKRGIRGAYMVNGELDLAAGSSQTWQIIANVEQSQAQAVALKQQLNNPEQLQQKIKDSIAHGSDDLARIMASGDAFQCTAEEEVSVHHYANVQFNLLRGGVFDNHYSITKKDFIATIKQFNQGVFTEHQEFLSILPAHCSFIDLLALVKKQNSAQLERLCYEYLPIMFGRRHGDPSRPWNQFAINLTDENDERILTYQGNWRDIFQNWEALTFSNPEFIENIICKFVNASTIDGYNPYRVTKEGIDWEVEDPADPWSYIGYWGDHQIIYLQKMLELSAQFHPQRLTEFLTKPIFTYANVPYRIKAFSDLLINAKDTVEYDDELAAEIEKRVAEIGSDGKLLLASDGQVYLVNLFEKLLVTLLSKLSNFVVDGGIWLNTQRPEWNDANNALVGQGLSMVTLSYLRRYIQFLQTLLSQQTGSFTLSAEVSQWFAQTAKAITNLSELVKADALTPQERFASLNELGQFASNYRLTVYKNGGFSGTAEQSVSDVQTLLSDALIAIDKTIAFNKRSDGLYNAYNLLALKPESLSIDALYPMLEGQVAALSSGVLAPKEAAQVVESLFASDVYRNDQKTFMLYPDRQLPSFLAKNTIDSEQLKAIPGVLNLLESNNTAIIEQDIEGTYRFNSAFKNVSDLIAQIDVIASSEIPELLQSKQALSELFESVFNHQEFTGRSGGMFGFEGLGCIYWHMVSKLLLAVQENYFNAIATNANTEVSQQLANLYYQVREGIGFNKSPSEYGAFPTDPYSHTPKHAGAQQPGMTGQVKEEILTRFGELGIRVNNGEVQFLPSLLRSQEFAATQRKFKFLDIDNCWQEILLANNSLAFTWCQIPIVYQLTNNEDVNEQLTVSFNDSSEKIIDGNTLSTDLSSLIFTKAGLIRRITLKVSASSLFVQ
ncbi:hypothetical protein [Thalassomonas sp. M1454]|uniref:hypothetical protein n=1 Tax=Thalassomonas sp. M1454 TaxID=2594477 RepID=UPI00117ED312|nr:hypothetical protein [Thalassomonas sp. M1454]TRX52839.1 hypothetical protein FNN08_15910 [Thalassomonas sp. M1454]